MGIYCLTAGVPKQTEVNKFKVSKRIEGEYNVSSKMLSFDFALWKLPAGIACNITMMHRRFHCRLGMLSASFKSGKGTQIICIKWKEWK